MEAVLATALFAVFISAFAGIFVYGELSSVSASERNRAFLVAEEGLEAARAIGRSDFTALQDGSFGMGVENGAWHLLPDPDTSSIFIRRITVETVNADEKHIVCEVEWQHDATRDGEIRLETYVSNWHQ